MKSSFARCGRYHLRVRRRPATTSLVDPKTGKIVALDALLDEVSAAGIAKQRRVYGPWRERSHVEAPLASLGTQNAAGWRLIDNQIGLSFWSSTTFRTTSTVTPSMLRQSADAKMKEGERRGVGRATPLLFEGRKLLRSGARHERRSKIIAGKAVRAVNRVRGSDALEPLKQSQRLWVIREAV